MDELARTMLRDGNNQACLLEEVVKFSAFKNCRR